MYAIQLVVVTAFTTAADCTFTMYYNMKTMRMNRHATCHHSKVKVVDPQSYHNCIVLVLYLWVLSCPRVTLASLIVAPVQRPCWIQTQCTFTSGAANSRCFANTLINTRFLQLDNVYAHYKSSVGLCWDVSGIDGVCQAQYRTSQATVHGIGTS